MLKQEYLSARDFVKYKQTEDARDTSYFKE